jgi:hypothetical protein
MKTFPCPNGLSEGTKGLSEGRHPRPCYPTTQRDKQARAALQMPANWEQTIRRRRCWLRILRRSIGWKLRDADLTHVPNLSQIGQRYPLSDKRVWKDDSLTPASLPPRAPPSATLGSKPPSFDQRELGGVLRHGKFVPSVSKCSGSGSRLVIFTTRGYGGNPTCMG